MELELKRQVNSEHGCEGELSVDGFLECYTLEPPEGMEDCRGITAVPVGHYMVVLAFSPHLRATAPQLLSVPGRSHILIHWGNYETCTEGCILVGEQRGPSDEVWNSRAAFDDLYAHIAEAIAQREPVHITILPAPPPAVEV